MVNCSLCRQQAPRDHRRSKKLYGTSCASARATLERLSPDGFQFLRMTSGPDAVLCYGCEKKLSTVESLERKLCDAKKTVMDLLVCVQPSDADSRRSEISHVSSAPPAKGPCLSSSQPLLSLSQLPPSITPSTQQPAVDPSSTAPPPPSVCQPLSAVGSSSTQQAPANSPSASSQLMSDQPNRGVQLSVNPDLSEPSCSSSPPVEVSACLSLLFAINCYTTYNIIMINISLPFLTNMVGVNLSSEPPHERNL